MTDDTATETVEETDTPTDEFAELRAEIAYLRKQMGLREQRVENLQADEEVRPELALAHLDHDRFEGQTKISAQRKRELHAPMVELAVPEAQFPEECLYAVRLSSQGDGYWPAFPLPRRNVRLADPQVALLVPKLKNGEMRPVQGDGVPDALRNPAKNFIGYGNVIPWYVPNFRGGVEVYCDPRAAAASDATGVVITKISLWCPLYTASPGSKEHHEVHGAFCGVGEDPDFIQAMKWQPKGDDDTGRCLGCKPHEQMRAAVRAEVSRVRSRMGV